MISFFFLIEKLESSERQAEKKTALNGYSGNMSHKFN